MTQQELEQLKPLNKEIAQQQKRLKELEALLKGHRTRVDGMPQILPEQNSEEIRQIIGELKTEIEHNLKKCLSMAAKMQNWIDGVEDSEMRMILSLRYLNGLTWSQVAFSIGEYDEQYPRRRNNAFFGEKRTKKDK